MKQETQVLPIRCRGCNTMFDLWPILQEQEKASNVVLTENHFARLLTQSFCQDCRRAVMMGLVEQENAYEENESDSDAEIEMMLELE